jgi:hypothetical protein
MTGSWSYGPPAAPVLPTTCASSSRTGTALSHADVACVSFSLIRIGVGPVGGRRDHGAARRRSGGPGQSTTVSLREEIPLRLHALLGELAAE